DQTIAGPGPRRTDSVPGSSGLGVVVFRFEVDAGLGPLGLGDRGRGLGQRMEAAAGLREGDDFAGRVATGGPGHYAVPAEGDSAVRGSAVLEGVEKEAELIRRLLFGDTRDLEHTLLDVPAVDADRTAADLVSVAYDVVGIGQGRTGIGVERVE